MWQCVAVRAAVCGSALYVYTHKVAHNIYWYALVGAVGVMSPTFLVYYYQQINIIELKY
jgi:hypothetical protein